jgi:hypothetical protein
LVIQNHLVSARRARYGLVSGRSHRTDNARSAMACKLDRTHPDSASSPLHQNRAPLNVAPDMDGAMGRDAGYP